MALFLQELALFETTNETLVKLTNIMEGVNGAAVFGYNTEQVAIRINGNQTLQYATRHTLEIRVSDDATPATQAILTEWANDPELRFKASGYGGGEFLLWDEPVPIVFERQRDGVASRHLTMTLDAVPGFTGASGLQKMPVYAGPNLLGIYNVLTASGGSVLNGFQDVGLVGDGVSGANQTIEIDADPETSYLESASLLFPFQNVRLTLSAYCVSTTGLFTSGYAEFTNDGTLISRDYGAYEIGDTGRLTADFSIDANVVFIRAGFSGSLLSTSVFNTPTIRLGDESTWTP